MFKFLFRRKGEIETVKETQRQTFERALGEVNEILVQLDPKPRVTVDPEAGTIAFEMPDQMPDEALALPKPEPEAQPEPESQPEPEAEDKPEASGSAAPEGDKTKSAA